jgi:ankyrin repeat protein
MATPLYYASLCGFYDLAEHFIMEHPQQVNAIGGHYASPLGAALVGEHFDVAQLLYQHGADVDVRGIYGWTPLASASRGHRKLVEWLLGHGADPNIRGETFFFAPLHIAAYHRQGRDLTDIAPAQGGPECPGPTRSDSITLSIGTRGHQPRSIAARTRCRRECPG